MEISRKNKIYQVTSDKYEVRHLYMHDKFCDLHLLAHNEDKSEQLLIPVHKIILIDNLEYFANMFKDTSNFIENNRELNTEIPVISIQVENPSQFGEYLALFYNQKLNLTGKNFLDYYKMADFFTDNKMIEEISNFMNSLSANDKWTNNNIVELSRYTEKFDKVIIYYIDNFLNAKQAYNLSQISNRFKENLVNFFENPMFEMFNNTFAKKITVGQQGNSGGFSFGKKEDYNKISDVGTDEAISDSSSEVSEKEEWKFTDGYDLYCIGDAEDKAKLKKMSETDKEAELYSRIEAREKSQTKKRYQRKLKIKRKKQRRLKRELQRKKKKENDRIHAACTGFSFGSTKKDDDNTINSGFSFGKTNTTPHITRGFSFGSK